MKKALALYMIGTLILVSVLSFAMYNWITPDYSDIKDDIPGDGPDDTDGTLPIEVQNKWREYSDSIESPDIITTDPGLMRAKQGQTLERLAYLEGLNNFTDSDDGSTGNTSKEFGVGAGDADAAPSADEAQNDGASEKTREVEEADLVKIIGDTMFVLNSYRGLIAIDISDPAEAHIEGQAKVIGYPVEMYVVDFLAIITVRTNFNFWYRYWGMETDTEDSSDDNETETGAIGTIIYIVNVDDPSKPKILKMVELEGFPVESRRVGNVIYQATNTYGWYYYDAVDQETLVSSIGFGDPDTVGLVDQERFSGSANQVHASPTAFYIAQPIWDYNDEWVPWDEYKYYTMVTYLDISDPDGEIERNDSFRSPGYLQDKYQMDEYNGYFRMVTHFWTGIGESRLYIFDISDPNDIEQISSLLIDDAGTLMATRFAGERAYTIHLPRSIDPLDVLDLSDPKEPKLTDIFEMPGWVTHMEVKGFKIIALGVDDSEGQRNVAVSLFDVTDPYNAKMQDRVRLGGDYAYSAANWEPKALTIDDTKNIVIVPYSSYNEKAVYGIQLVGFDLNTGELTLKGSAESDYTIERTRVAGDYVLATSFRTLQVVDIDELNDPEVVRVVNLAVNVRDVVPAGDLYLQLTQDWYTNNMELRTVEDPDDIEAKDSYEVNAYWGKLIETDQGLLLATNIYTQSNSDNKYQYETDGILYKIKIGDSGKITLTKLAELPDGVVFSDSYYYGYYYDDYYYLEDDVDMGMGARSIPYYNNYFGERFIVTDDALVYYNIGTHPYREWVYNYTIDRYVPVPDNKGSDTIYVFDLSDISNGATMTSKDLDTFSLMGLTSHGDKIYVQHRMYDVLIYEDSSDWPYYKTMYKNYVLEVDVSDNKNPEVTGDYNIPGKLIGAGDDVLYSISEWADSNSNITLNTLTLNNNTAVISSAVKIGTGYVEAKIVDDKAYVISRPYDYYYYWMDYDDIARNTTFMIIDLGDPETPGLDASVELEGYFNLVAVGAGHIVLHNSEESSLVLYSTDTADGLEFEAMILLLSGYNEIRVYEDVLYIPQGYYGVQVADI